MKTQKFPPLRSTSDPSISLPLVGRLIAECDTAHRQSGSRERRQIWVVDCGGRLYTVAIDYRRNHAYVTRGDARTLTA